MARPTNNFHEDILDVVIQAPNYFGNHLISLVPWAPSINLNNAFNTTSFWFQVYCFPKNSHSKNVEQKVSAFSSDRENIPL